MRNKNYSWFLQRPEQDPASLASIGVDCNRDGYTGRGGLLIDRGLAMR